MLASIGLGLFILGIIYVAIWSVRNDDASSIGDQTGFIRMRLSRSPRPRTRQRAADPAVAAPPRRIPASTTAQPAEPPAHRIGRPHHRN